VQALQTHYMLYVLAVSNLTNTQQGDYLRAYPKSPGASAGRQSNGGLYRL